MKVCPACNREYPQEEAVCADDGVALVRVDSRDQQAQDLIGSVVDGRYRLERVVGRGGMGTVYACRHVVVGKTFAMKVLRSGVERSEEILQRFIREAQATNAIKSRHICEMTDFGQLPGGAFYIVMELLNGISLTRALREKRLNRQAIIRVFSQIAETLERAHAVGIVHRDLKPDNVVLVEDESDPYFVKLVDFGIAKIIRAKATDLTETGIILGTPYYMSPEQARGDSVDHRSDIYALGVIMYRAFTGRLPFMADTQMGVLTRHLTEPPKLPSVVANVDNITERLILRCLEKRPIDRFQSMLDVVEALASLPEEPSLRESADSNPTFDERAFKHKQGPNSARSDSPGRSERPPRPSVPANTEPTPTKLETPQAQNRQGLGQPLPFPVSPPDSAGPDGAPRSLPPPLPARGSDGRGPSTATPPPAGSFQAIGSQPPTPSAPIHHSAPGPFHSHDAAPGLTPNPQASHPPAARATYPSGDFPNQLPPNMQSESLTNRGVVSSGYRAARRKRQAQRAAAWVTVGVAGIAIGSVIAVVVVSNRDAGQPAPANSQNTVQVPSGSAPSPTMSSTNDPTADSDTHPAASAAPTDDTEPAASAESAASAEPSATPSPAQRPLRPYRPPSPPKPDTRHDDIRSPFD